MKFFATVSKISHEPLMRFSSTWAQIVHWLILYKMDHIGHHMCCGCIFTGAERLKKRAKNAFLTLIARQIFSIGPSA